MPEIVITEFVDDATVKDLKRDYEVLFDPGLADRPSDIAALLGDCRALIVRNRTQVTAEMLQAGPKLAVIGRLGVGLDNIDLEACGERGIEVCPALGANTISVAEYTVAAMLILLKRGIFAATERVVTGEWPRTELMGLEAAGRSFGLIGYGVISREVAVRVAALGMTVRGYDPLISDDDPAWGGTMPSSIDDILERSDVISCHVPINKDTYHIIDAAAIGRMRPGTIVINASRGGVLDETAVIEGLRAGKLGGAALDVFEYEPLNEDTGAAFDDVPNLILTPHVAWATEEADVRTGEVTVANVRRVLQRAPA